MRRNFERGLYEREAYHYSQKVNALKEKLELLNHIPEPTINRAAQTWFDLRETWGSTTQEEHRGLVLIMIQEVGVGVEIKRILWVQARSKYEPLNSILDGMHQERDRRFWIE